MLFYFCIENRNIVSKNKNTLCLFGDTGCFVHECVEIEPLSDNCYDLSFFSKEKFFLRVVNFIKGTEPPISRHAML